MEEGFFLTNNSVSLIDNCDISHNIAANQAGGVYLTSTAIATISGGTVIQFNTGITAGGLLVNMFATFTFIDSSMSFNTAINATGGFYCGTSNAITFSNYSLNNNSLLNKEDNVNCSNACSSNTICTSCNPECSLNGCPSGVYGLDCLSICPNCYSGTCNNTRNAVVPCVCNPGFDQSTNCTDCLLNNWGPTCSGNCSDCGYGTCNNTIKGNGKCICQEGFDPSINCNNCLPTLFGETCPATCFAPYCYGHGTCSYGIRGGGGCICDSLYDPVTYCKTTISTGTNPTIVIIAATLGSVIFLIIIVCAGFYISHRKLKRITSEVYVGKNINVEESYEYRAASPKFVMDSIKNNDDLVNAYDFKNLSYTSSDNTY